MSSAAKGLPLNSAWSVRGARSATSLLSRAPFSNDRSQAYNLMFRTFYFGDPANSAVFSSAGVATFAGVGSDDTATDYALISSAGVATASFATQLEFHAAFSMDSATSVEFGAGLATPIADSAAWTDAATYEITTPVVSSISFTQTLSTAGTVNFATLSDALNLTQVVTLVNSADVSSAIDFTGATVEQWTRIVALVDTLRLSGTATNTYHALALLVDTLTFEASTGSVVPVDLSSSVNLADTISALASYFEDLVSSIAVTDAAVGKAVVTVLLEDEFDFSDTASARGSFIAALQDELAFAVTFDLGDTAYVAYSMNAATKGLTSYTNFNFNSLASFYGNVYAAGTGGLYQLGGTTDDGDEIGWRIRTGLSNFGSGRQKGLDAVYIGYTGTGLIVLKTIVVKPNGDKHAYWYEMTPSTGSMHPGRVLVGRGLKSVYWGFELTNIDVTDSADGSIALDVVELHPVVFEGRLP